MDKYLNNQPGGSVDPSELLPTVELASVVLSPCVVLPPDELPSELHDEGRVMSTAPITACKFAHYIVITSAKDCRHIVTLQSTSAVTSV